MGFCKSGRTEFHNIVSRKENIKMKILTFLMCSYLNFLAQKAKTEQLNEKIIRMKYVENILKVFKKDLKLKKTYRDTTITKREQKQ